MSGLEVEETAVDRASAYYDSPDADAFYFHVWGGEDIHIGLYESPDDPISVASRRTVVRMAERLSGLPADARILDIGSGFGGSARYLARELGCPVTCLNLSAVQNERNRELNRAAGLGGRIEVVDGNFEELPFADRSFHAVWSQDAILHSGNRVRVLDEVDRVLMPGGLFIFTDPMQAEDANPAGLERVLARIHLDSLGSIGFYRDQARRLGWHVVEIDDLSHQLPQHYTRVLNELESREAELDAVCSRDYQARMKAGLKHWIDAGQRKDLAWGILCFRKAE